MVFFVQWCLAPALAFVHLSFKPLVNLDLQITCGSHKAVTAVVPLEEATDFAVRILDWMNTDHVAACSSMLEGVPFLVSLGITADTFRFNIVKKDVDAFLVDSMRTLTIPRNTGKSLDVFGPCVIHLSESGVTCERRLALTKPIFEVITRSEQNYDVHQALSWDEILYVPVGPGFLKIQSSAEENATLTNLSEDELRLSSGAVLLPGNSTLVQSNSLVDVYRGNTTVQLYLIHHRQLPRFSVKVNGELIATSYSPDEPLTIRGIHFRRPYGSEQVIASYETLKGATLHESGGDVILMNGTSITGESGDIIEVAQNGLVEPTINLEDMRRVPSPLYFQLEKILSMKNDSIINVTSEMLLPGDLRFDGSLVISRSPSIVVENHFGDEECVIEIGGIALPPFAKVTLTNPSVGSIIHKGERITRFLISSFDFN